LVDVNYLFFNSHPSDVGAGHDDVRLGTVDVVFEAVERRHFVHQ